MTEAEIAELRNAVAQEARAGIGARVYVANAAAAAALVAGGFALHGGVYVGKATFRLTPAGRTAAARNRTHEDG